MSDALPTGIRDAGNAIRAGTISAVELMTACLNAADRLDRELNVFAARNDRATLLGQAAVVDRRRKTGDPLGPLAGIPIALKDIYLSSDLPTTASSKVLAGHRTGEDAVTVARLRQAGALIIGKAHTHEFAFGATTVNEFAGPSRNPWNPDHVPGGSSGGSAIAVATGMCLGATASDTGGSIRHPSAFCGVTGLKPTYGLVSRRGIFALSWSLDHAGPMARSVEDIAFLLHSMAGYDPHDPGSIEVSIPDYVAQLGKAPERLRIGVPREHFLDVVDAEVRGAFDHCLTLFEGFGWQVEEVSLPYIRYALGAELAILGAESAALHRDMLRTRGDDVSANVRRELDAGTMILATDYLLGQRVRRRIAEDFAAAFREVDMLATPTIPITAPRIDQTDVEIGGEVFSISDAIWRNAYPTNLTGSPTLALPCGFSKAGLPISLQLIGRNFGELPLLQAGARFQAETSWHKAAPPICSP